MVQGFNFNFIQNVNKMHEQHNADDKERNRWII